MLAKVKHIQAILARGLLNPLSTPISSLLLFFSLYSPRLFMEV